ncbi:MAG: LAGLIDADG family homing endonuclease [bacterium]|nr:LAGLIDADG family homing endonuclease [bacterium]
MLSADYLVGLTDGEGSFTVYLRAPLKKHGAKNYRVECHYYLKMRDDDRALIGKIKHFFKVGRISFQKDYRPNHHHCYRYEVTNLKEIVQVIIPFFDQHKLQGNKMRDFTLFKRVIRAVLKKHHQTQQGLVQIQKLKNQMHIYRTR